MLRSTGFGFDLSRRTICRTASVFASRSVFQTRSRSRARNRQLRFVSLDVTSFMDANLTHGEVMSKKFLHVR